MNLQEMTKNGINAIYVSDSLNASLLEMKVKSITNTVLPNNNDLIIYVDKDLPNNPTSDRKEYLFELSDVLNSNDEFVLQTEIVNNKIKLKAYVNRIINNEIVIEELEVSPIILFSGENYIYTNYVNAELNLIYPKNTDFNKYALLNILGINNNLNNFSIDDIYFKDCFTKTMNKMNLEVNDIKIDSILSNNNKFSLDNNGNLIVNSITANTGLDFDIDNESICNLIYPVGSIYMSVNNVNPSTLFGGTWQQLKDRFLLGAGDTYTNGSTGGASTHTLTINEMPLHTHIQNSHTHTGRSKGFIGITANTTSNAYYLGRRIKNGDGYDDSTSQATNATTATNQNTGGGIAHNNMPPYLTVYIWKRTA